MAFVTLFNTDTGLLASDQFVYDATEARGVNTVEELVEQLEQYAGDQDRLIEEKSAEAIVAGLKEGQRQAKQELDKKVSESLLEHDRLLQESIDKNRSESVEVALEIVRRIGLDMNNSEVIVNLATKIVHELVPDPEVVLAVSLLDEASVVDRLEDMGMKISDSRISVVGDLTLGPGEAVLRTQSGSLTAGLEVQLESLSRMLAR